MGSPELPPSLLRARRHPAGAPARSGSRHLRRRCLDRTGPIQAHGARSWDSAASLGLPVRRGQRAHVCARARWTARDLVPLAGCCTAERCGGRATLVPDPVHVGNHAPHRDARGGALREPAPVAGIARGRAQAHRRPFGTHRHGEPHGPRTVPHVPMAAVQPRAARPPGHSYPVRRHPGRASTVAASPSTGPGAARGIAGGGGPPGPRPRSPRALLAGRARSVRCPPRRWPRV